MRIWIIGVLSVAILLSAAYVFQYIKFDTAISITVAKSPFKGLNCKLIHYKVSYADMQVQDDFWQSHLGRAIFNELSLTLQTMVLASKKYVYVQFEVNYLGLVRRHYQLVDENGMLGIQLV